MFRTVPLSITRSLTLNTQHFLEYSYYFNFLHNTEFYLHMFHNLTAAFNKRKNIFTSKLDLNLRKKLVKCYVWSMALYGAEAWTLWATDQKRLESFEMWCWRRMEKISWTDHVRNEEVLLRVNEQRDILHEIRKQKANWIGHIFRRNCLLQQVIEGKIKG